MQKRNLTYLILLVVFLVLPMTLAAQGDSGRLSEAYYDLLQESLAQSGLMVVLKTNNNKIKALNEAMANSPTQQRRLQNLLDETQQETQQQQALFVQKVQEHYTATPVYFVFDTALVAIKEGRLKQVINVKDRTIDTDRRLPAADMPYLISGSGNNEYTNGSEGLLVVYRDAESLIKYDSFGFFFNFFLARDIAEARRLDKALRKLHEGVQALLGQEEARKFRWTSDFYPTTVPGTSLE